MDTTNLPHNADGTVQACAERVRRGGPSSDGGYDRMNVTRYEPCNRPVAERVGGRWVCKHHANRARA